MVKVKQYRVCLKPEGTLKVSDVEIATSADAERVLLGWYRKEMPAGECLLVLGVDVRNHIVGIVEVSRGGVSGAAVTSREIFQAALAMNSSAFILSHNHPSEDPTPSAQDILMTLEVKKASKVIGVELLDHLVVAVRSGEIRSVLNYM